VGDGYAFLAIDIMRGFSLESDSKTIPAMNALMVVGAAGYLHLGVDRYPSVDMPTVRISTRLPGASPAEVESLIAQRIAAALDKAGSLSFETLVKTVAEELYQQELRNGAAVLDIGLFGSRLFFPEVLGELRAGDGIYWEIKKVREAV
jgi:hypothetical protein